MFRFFHLSEYLSGASEKYDEQEGKEWLKNDRKNRSAVQKRLKIHGAWWKPKTAECMLALRCVRMNGDWERYWRHISPSFARAA